MHARRSPSPALDRLSDAQEGTITRAQALPDVGEHAIARLLRQGHWSVVTPGIYATTRTPSARHRLWAGALLGGSTAALGGEAALFLAGLRPEPASIETWVPLGVRRDPRPGWQFPRDGWERLPHARGMLPSIRTDEAILDVSRSLDPEDWIGLVAAAARERLVSLAELKRRAEARPRIARRSMLLAVLADFQGIESTLELAYMRDVERRHGLPTATRQVVVIAGSRSDVRYDGYSLLVELDGRHHIGREFRDLDRDNAHGVLGETTLRYGSRDVRTRPCRVAWQVGAALARRGWTGTPRRCPRCPDDAQARAVQGVGRPGVAATRRLSA